MKVTVVLLQNLYTYMCNYQYTYPQNFFLDKKKKNFTVTCTVIFKSQITVILQA